MHDAQRRFMVDRSGGHGTDEGDVISNGAGVREELRQLHAALAMRTKLVGRAQDIAGLLVEVDLQVASRIGLATPAIQSGLGVEEVHLAGPAMLEQADHGPRPGPPMGRRRGSRSEQPPPREQVLQRHPPQASGRAPQEAATGQGFEGRIHRT